LRNLRETLKFKTDSDFDGGPRDTREKSVVESCASSEAASFGGESQPGDNDKVQLLRPRARGRLADPESARYELRERSDWTKRKNAVFAPRIADQMILEQAEVPQKVEVRFS
jgi:hypothetical protein